MFLELPSSVLSHILYRKMYLIETTENRVYGISFFHPPPSGKSPCPRIRTWRETVAVDASSEAYHGTFPETPLTSWRSRVVAAPAFALSEFPTARTFTGRFSSATHPPAVAS